VQRETALAWIRRHTIERQLERLDGLYEENRLFDAAVRARLASPPAMRSGGAMAADAVMPKLEAAMLDERRDEFSMQRAQAVAALARWVGEAAREPLEGDLPSWPLHAAELRDRLHRHPELRAVGAMAGELDAELREAQAMKKPDWGIEVAYQRRGREFGDMVSVMLMVELPVFAADRQDPKIAAKAAERAAVDAERAAMAREHLQMLEADVAELERLDRALARQRDTVLPLARERIDLATAAYRGGQGALMDVVTARRERVEAELKTIALEGERMATAARLHFAAGEGETR
jgi:outer membrane protein TolC